MTSRLIKSNVICGDKIVDGNRTVVCDLLTDGEIKVNVSDLLLNNEKDDTNNIDPGNDTNNNIDPGNDTNINTPTEYKLFKITKFNNKELREFKTTAINTFIMEEDESFVIDSPLVWLFATFKPNTETNSTDIEIFEWTAAQLGYSSVELPCYGVLTSSYSFDQLVNFNRFYTIEFEDGQKMEMNLVLGTKSTTRFKTTLLNTLI